MKRLMVVIMMIITLSAPSFGEPFSSDMSEYVRRDVLEVHLSNINSNLEKILSEMIAQRQELESQRREINELTKVTAVLSERVDGLDAKLSARIDALDAKQTAQIDGLDARMGDLRNDIYLGLVILGIIVSLPVVQKMLQSREKTDRPHYLTLEDAEKLIDAKLREAGGIRQSPRV